MFSVKDSLLTTHWYYNNNWSSKVQERIKLFLISGLFIAINPRLVPKPQTLFFRFKHSPVDKMSTTDNWSQLDVH